MDLEQRVEELKQKIERIKSCYFKGFGARLGGIFADAANYVNYPEEREENKQHILGLYSEIDEFYKQIPFDDLQCDEDFAPLFVVRRLLPKFEKRMQDVLQSLDNKKIERLGNLVITIGEMGELFRQTFLGYIDQVREIPGNENYSVVITDNLGRRYAFCGSYKPE